MNTANGSSNETYTAPGQEEKIGSFWFCVGAFSSVVLAVLIPVTIFFLDPLSSPVVESMFEWTPIIILFYVWSQAMSVLKRPITMEGRVFTDYWTTFLPFAAVVVTVTIGFTAAAMREDTWNIVQWLSEFSPRAWKFMFAVTLGFLIDFTLLRIGYLLALLASDLFSMK